MKITIKRDWNNAQIEVFMDNDGCGATATVEDFTNALVRNLKIFKTKKNVRKAFDLTCEQLKKEVIRAN